MAWNFFHFEQLNQYADYGLQNTTVPEVAVAVDSVFDLNRYNLERGDAADGTYGIGNEVAYMFLGLFIRRFKFRTRIWAEGPSVYFRFEKGMSGAMAGVFGYTRNNKEYSRLIEVFHSNFSQQLGEREIVAELAQPPHQIVKPN